MKMQSCLTKLLEGKIKPKGHDRFRLCAFMSAAVWILHWLSKTILYPFKSFTSLLTLRIFRSAQ